DDRICLPRTASSCPSPSRALPEEEIGAGLFAALGWCWRVDSNHRPTDYESVALPAELRQPRVPRTKGERALYQRQNRGQTTIFLRGKAAGLQPSKMVVCPRFF